MSEGKRGDALMNHDPLAELEADASAAVAQEHAPVALGDSLGIAEVAELHERLRAALELGGSVQLDGAEVEQVDAAGLQLLCSAARTARAQGGALVWRGASERLRAGARQLGLEPELGL